MRSFFRVILATLLFVLAAVPALAESYRLLPQDRLSVRAMRWDPLSASYMIWDGVSGEFALAGDGTLMFPLVGQVEAAGLTTLELSQMLELELSSQTGMAEPPKVALEVISHLPVFVLGDVNSPGAYAYHPGMTAQQVLALAGGPIRPPIQFGANNDFQIMRMGGEMRLLSTQIDELEDERQRLKADLASLQEEGIETGTDAAPDAPGGLEGEILEATMNAREGLGERIRDLQEMLKEQISSLTIQLELRKTQIENVSRELENLNQLKEKGLTVSNRVTTMTNLLNDLESKRLDQEVALMLARQELNRAERDELELDDKARSDALVQLNAVERELAALRTRLDTAASLHGELAAAGLLSEDDIASEVVIEYIVTRAGGTAPRKIDGTEAVQPGDTIEVVRRTIVTSN
ncbi:polysaccharide biosynthesis/export family protein [Ruegeria arenilitoris]|uniref:polysaccharide biosynthesis/export family protein n=1 Tax=Ruegeria arenilitoris TaxID=1173585 RepID=UPI00147C0ED8|nr:polysaccharide biosynthesis/export family protein [Ruegeria arenilitoris]